MSNLQISQLIIKEGNNTLVNLFENNDINLDIQSSLALVGQSGSGKSLSLKTILGMLPKNLTTQFKYTSDFELSKQNIGFIPQNPFTSLSPMTKIYKQFFCDEEKIKELFELVKLDIELQDKFPVQLSGGQLQRVVIAIALSNNPKLLLLDEPTTALDSQSKENILSILKELQEKLEFLIIFVSHDIQSVENICEEIAVLKNGVICEYGKTLDIIKNPQNSYTQELLTSNFENRGFRV